VAPEPVAAAPANPPPRPQPSAPSRPAPSSGELVAVNAPQPVYPPEARRLRTSGEVTVSFTVNADGSVSNVDVLNARPRGVFERNVQNAVRKWRFQPTNGPQSVTRTFSFAP
jgi:protein TonB